MNYQDEIKARLGQIVLTLLDLLKSKKFLAAVGGAVTTYQATGDPWVFLWATLAFVAAQGLADFGKEGQAISATAALLKQPAAQPAKAAPGNQLPLPTPGRSVTHVYPPNLAKLLVEAGYPTLESVKVADNETLYKAGLTPIQVDTIRKLAE